MSRRKDSRLSTGLLFLVFLTISISKCPSSTNLLDTYSEPSQRFKIDLFVKTVKNCDYFSKALHLRCSMYCMMHIQNPVYYRKFRHTQACSRPIKTYSAIFMAYLEPCHIQNAGMFRT